MPEPGGVALQLDVLAVPQVPAARVERDDELGVERTVVGRQLGQLERPEERAERLALPHGVDDRGVVRSLGQPREGVLELAAHRATTLDDLAPATGPCGATCTQT